MYTFSIIGATEVVRTPNQIEFFLLVVFWIATLFNGTFMVLAIFDKEIVDLERRTRIIYFIISTTLTLALMNIVFGGQLDLIMSVCALSVVAIASCAIAILGIKKRQAYKWMPMLSILGICIVMIILIVTNTTW